MPDDPPILSLLTDFGTSDAYVGIMKGVILGRCPDARIVDITHAVPQGAIRAADYILGAAWPHFPAGTVHAIVVDPGVGSDRPILAVETGGHTFVAPDNGVLTSILEAETPRRIVTVENAELFKHPVSRTFHGRDIFAPVAAALAAGADLDELGPDAAGYVHLPRHEPTTDETGALLGTVVYIDAFGNLITNITVDQLPAEPVIDIAGRIIRGLAASYADLDPGQPLAIVGSTDRLEISISQGDAAATLPAAIGDTVRVADRQAEKGRPV